MLAKDYMFLALCWNDARVISFHRRYLKVGFREGVTIIHRESHNKRQFLKQNETCIWQ